MNPRQLQDAAIRLQHSVNRAEREGITVAAAVVADSQDETAWWAARKAEENAAAKARRDARLAGRRVRVYRDGPGRLVIRWRRS